MRIASFIRDNAAFLAAGFLLAFSSSYGQTYFISVYAGEIRAEFGLSHGAWGGIYTVGTTASALTMVWAGLLVDRFRIRVLCIAVGLVLATACIAMALVPGWVALVGVIYVLRLAGQSMMGEMAGIAMARWFVRSRGLALSLASMGVSLGQASLPVIFVALMSVMDWRWTWVIAAGLTLAVLPVIVRLLRLERTPQSLAAQSDSASGMCGHQWTRQDALRHWLFWLIAPIIIGPPTWGTALFFQQVHLAEVKGWTLIEFVSLLPLYTVAMVTMTLISGWAVDRFGAVRLLPALAIPWGLAFLILSTAQSLLLGGLGLFAAGLAAGAQATLLPAFWAEVYGTRHLGAIKTLAAAQMVLGTAIGPGLTGVLIDAGLTFPEQMIGIVIYFMVAGAMCAYAVVRTLPALPGPP